MTKDKDELIKYSNLYGEKYEDTPIAILDPYQLVINRCD
jgi:hypothetical protein